MDLLKHVSKHHFKDEDEKKLNAEHDELFDNMLLNGLEDNKGMKKTQSLYSEKQCWMSLWTKKKSEIIKHNY